MTYRLSLIFNVEFNCVEICILQLVFEVSITYVLLIFYIKPYSYFYQYILAYLQHYSFISSTYMPQLMIYQVILTFYNDIFHVGLTWGVAGEDLHLTECQISIYFSPYYCNLLGSLCTTFDYIGISSFFVVYCSTESFVQIYLVNYTISYFYLFLSSKYCPRNKITVSQD